MVTPTSLLPSPPPSLSPGAEVGPRGDSTPAENVVGLATSGQRQSCCWDLGHYTVDRVPEKKKQNIVVGTAEKLEKSYVH